MSRLATEFQTDALNDVEEHATRAAMTLTELEDVIRGAAEAGCSLRDIAKRAGVSHMAVKRCLTRIGHDKPT